MLSQPFTRSAGILLHPTSLHGNEGIGTLGKSAYHFIDWLYTAHIRLRGFSLCGIFEFCR